MFIRSAPQRRWRYVYRFLVVALFLVISLYFTHLVASGAGLPPRHLPNGSDEQSSGVMMQLRGRFSDDWPFEKLHWQQDLWLVVQWQSGNGLWQDVPGWQGHFDAIQFQDQWLGQKWLWADESLLGSGPYRWLIIDTKNSQMMGVSTPFYLPTDADESIIVDLSVSP